MWFQTQQLVAHDPPQSGQRFGFSVAMGGDTLAVGAPLDSATGKRSGAVYLFTWDKEKSEFGLPSKVLAADGEPNMHFGSALAVDVLGKRLVVGTRRLGVVEQGKGLAYVFQNNGSSWLAETQLAPESSSGGGAVGGAVAIQESRILLSHGTPMSDLQPPEVSSMLPANMDQVVETQNVTELRIIFSETIVKDSDTAAFRIFQKVAPQASVINITVGSDQVRLENSDKAQLLDGEHEEGSYGDNGAFADLAILPNIWEGVFDEDDWTFRMGGGCYVTKTGCSVQGDKTFFQTFRDWKGEAEKNALTSQEACLLRARVHHVGCQQPVELPTRVLFEATGATRAFPPGCWISQPSCSNESAANKLGLYQDKDESVMLSGVDHEAACFAPRVRLPRQSGAPEGGIALRASRR
jgi:hypothetical protein